MTQAVAPGVNGTVRARPSIHFQAAPYRDFPFPSSYRKRKRSSTYSSEDETEVSFSQLPSSPIASSPDDSEGDHRNKRPRRTHIEYGMHGMSLQSHVSPVSSSGASVSGSSSRRTYSDGGFHHTHTISEPELLEVDEAFMPRDVEFDSNVGTPQVEEVPSPTASKNSEIGDVKMKGASRYEPEKDRESAT